MSVDIKEEVLKMTFDNEQFEQGTKVTMKTLEELKKSLNLEDSSKSFDTLNKSIRKVDVTPLITGFDQLRIKISAIDLFKFHFIDGLTKKIMDMGKKLVTSLSIDQITAGLKKYEDYTSSVQAILASTPHSIEEVEGYLGRLNKFTDETSFNLTDMTNNIGKFTSNRVPLELSVIAMEGIGTASALAGAKIQDASHAMEGFSKAIARGSMDLLNWKWIETSKMATAQFKESLIEAAVAEGTLIEKNGQFMTSNQKAAVSVENFNTTLSEKWLTKNVMIRTLNEYGGFADKITRLSTETGATVTEILEAIEEYRAATKAGNGYDFSEIAESLGLSIDQAKEIIDLLAGAEQSLGEKAFRASQEARSFGEAVEATKDAVSTGWMNTFKYIFGNYNQAKKLWTNLSETLYDLFATGAEARNRLLKAWNERGGYDLMVEGISTLEESLVNIKFAVDDAIAKIFPPISVERMIALTAVFKEFVKQIAPSEEGLAGFTKFLTIILSPLSKVVKGIQYLGIAVGAVILAISYGLDSLFSWFGKLESIENPLKNLFGDERYLKLAESAGKILGRVGAAFEKFKMAASSMFNSLRDSGVLTSFLERLGNAASFVKESLLDGVVWLFDKISNFSFSLDLKSFEPTLTFLGSSLSGLYPTLSKFYDWCVKAAGGFRELLTTADFSSFLAKLPNVSDVFGNLGASMKSFGSGVFNFIRENASAGIPGLLSALSDSIKSFGTSFKNLFSSVNIPDIGGSLSAFFDNIVASVRSMSFGIFDDAIKGFTSFAETVKNFIAGIDFSGGLNAFTGFFKTIKDSVASFPSEAIRFVLDTIGKLRDGIVSLLSGISGAFGNVSSNVLTTFFETFHFSDETMATIKKVTDTLKPFIDVIGNFLKNIAPQHVLIAAFALSIMKFIGSLSALLKGLTALSGGSLKVLVGLVKLMAGISTSFINLTNNVGKTIGRIGDSVNDISKGIQKKLRGTALDWLRELAKAMLFIGVSLKLISSIPPDNLKTSAIALGALTAGLAALSIVVGLISGSLKNEKAADNMVKLGKAFKSFSSGMLFMSGALFIVAQAVKATKEIDVVDLLKRLGVFAAFAGSMVLASALLSKVSPKLVLSSLAFWAFSMAFSASITTLLTALKLIPISFFEKVKTLFVGFFDTLGEVFGKFINGVKNLNPLEFIGVLVATVVGAASVGVLLVSLATLLHQIGIKFAVAVALLSGSLKLFQVVVTSMSNIEGLDEGIKNMGKLIAFLGVVGIAFAFLDTISAGAFSGAATTLVKLGIAANLLSISLIPMIGVIFLLSKMTNVDQAMNALWDIAGMMSLLMAVSHIAKGGQLIAAAAGIAILTGIMYLLVGLIAVINVAFKDWKVLAKGELAIAGLAAIFAGLMYASKWANAKAFATIIALTAAVTVLLTATALLSAIDESAVLAAGLAVSAVMGTLALVLAQSSKVTLKGMAGILVAAAAIAGLGAAFAYLPDISAQVPAIIAISAGLAGLVLVMTLLSRFADSAPKAGTAFIKFGAAIALMSAGLSLFVFAINQLQSSSPGLFDGIAALATSVAEFISGLFTGIAERVGPMIMAVVDAIRVNGPIIIQGLGEIITLIANTITTYLPVILQTVGTVVSSIITMIQSGAPMFFMAAFNLLISFLSGIRDNIEQVVMVAFEVIVNFIEGLATAVDEHGEDLLNAAGHLIEALVGAIGKSLGKVADAAADTVDAFAKNLVGEDKLKEIKQKGEDVVQGFLEGVENTPLIGDLYKAGVAFIDAVRGGAEDEGEIHSPSELFRRLGQFTGSGFLLGLADKAAEIEQAGRDMFHQLEGGYLEAAGQSSIFGKIKEFITENPVVKALEEAGKSASKGLGGGGGGKGGGGSTKKAVEVQIKSLEQLVKEYKTSYKDIEAIVKHYEQTVTKDFFGPSAAMLENYNKELGQFGKGNIDLWKRPQWMNEDGSISTVLSFSVEIDDKQVLLPMVTWVDGVEKMFDTEEEAIEHFMKSGEHLGMFDTIEEANEYAEKLHKAQEYFYKKGSFEKNTLAAANAIDLFSVKLYEAKDPANKLENQTKLLSEAIALIKGETKYASDAAKELAKSATEGATKEQQIMEITTKLYEERAKGIKAAMEEYKKSVSSAISSTMGLFDKLDDKTEISAESMLENSHNQLEYYEAWDAGLQELINQQENGVYTYGQEFIQYLIDQGVKSKPMIDALLRADEEQVTEILENFDRIQSITDGKYKSGDVEMPGFMSSMIERFGEFNEQLKKVTTDGGEEVIPAIDELGYKAFETVGKFFNEDSGHSFGMQLAYGLANGVDEGKAVVLTMIRELAEEVKETFAEETEINSPSKVFTEFGKYIDYGLANGITENVSKPLSAVESLADTISKIGRYMSGELDLNPVIRPTLDLSSVTASARGISSIFNKNRSVGILAEEEDTEDNGKGSYTFVQNNYSPKALSRIDIYRQTRNQFAEFREVANGI